MTSVRLSRHLIAAPSQEKIEIDASIRLHYMVNVKLDVSTMGAGCRPRPIRPSFNQFLLAQLDIKCSVLDVESDPVSCSYQCQRAPEGRLRRHVQDDETLTTTDLLVGGATQGRPALARTVKKLK